MGHIIKVQKELFFKSVNPSKKSIMLCTNPCTKSDVDRVIKMKANRGSNTGDSSMMFGSKEAKGFSLLPNFGINYFCSLDTNDHKPKDLPKVGDSFVLDTLIEFSEDTMADIYDLDESLQELPVEQLQETLVSDYIHLSVPAKPVVNKKKKPLTNCFWAAIPKN